MHFTLCSNQESTIEYLAYELGNLRRSMPIQFQVTENAVTASCCGELSKYFADELKSLICRWYDYCSKADYFRAQLPNPGLNAAVYEAYLQSLTLIREDYRAIDGLPLAPETNLDELCEWYLAEIRGEWDKIVRVAADYPFGDDRMAIRFVRKLRREIHPHMSFVKLTVTDSGYRFTDCEGNQLNFMPPRPPYSMLTDSVWLNAARVEVDCRTTRKLPVLDLVRDVNPDMAVSLVQALGE